MRVLHWPRYHGAGGHLHKIAVERDLFLTEEPRHRLESFEPLRPGLLGIESEAVELARGRGPAGTDVDTPVAEAVEHRGALRNTDRMVVGGRCEREPETESDVIGRVGRRTEHDLRRRHVRE